MTAPRHPEFPNLESALAGQFTIERELGRGGMGVVLLAHDLMLDRPVALKVLPSALAQQPSMRERFLREARTAARLSHPNIVPVYRADDVDGIAFFAMAYVEGESLAERLRDRERLPAAESVRILREVAWALAYAHAHGVVHRDVKPENILLDRATGRAIVTDFGIAHLAEASRLTQDGHVLGTVHYMSPEQACGDSLDGRSDIYSLGVVAYQMLSGHLPFEGMPAAAVIVAHATREAPPLRELAPDIPTSLDQIVGQCLAKRPEDRPATGEALAEALGQALAATPERDTLPPGLPPVLGQTEAEAVWRRAAQLQADALRRLEERRDLLKVPASDLARPAEGAPVDGGEFPTSGHKLNDVMDAAAEAGISRQYVAMALAEMPRGELAVAVESATGVSEKTATLYLGTEERSLGASLVVDATPAHVLRAVGNVLQQEPYGLRLRETVGGHPLDGGILVFDLPGTPWTLTSMYTTDRNNHWTSTRQALEAAQVQVTLRALPGEATRTELTMLCDLRPGVPRNVKASKLFGATAVVLGAFVGAPGGAAIVSATGATLLAAIPVLAGAAAIGAGTVAWYRWLYNHEAKKARDEMRRALEGVAASIKSERVFGSLPGSFLPREPLTDPRGAP